MAHLMGFFLSLTMIAFFALSVSVAEQFDVVWRPPGPNETEMYSQWASSNRFHVGDFIRFHYTNDSVFEVDKTGYYHCNSTTPIKVFHNGNSVVALQRTGTFYFTSGEQNGCKNGERLMLEVMAATPTHSGAAAASTMTFIYKLSLHLCICLASSVWILSK